MGLSVQIEDEGGEQTEEPWWHQRLNEALVAAHPGTCCLRFIDPYGNTLFNQLQLPVLLGELREARKRLADEELRSVVDDLTGLVQCAVGEVHIYVRFVGD